MMTSGKYPKCECSQKRYEYLRKRYKNGTLHMFRKCPACQKVAQSAMSQADYPAEWVASLPVSETGVMEQPVKPNLQSRADTVKTRVNPVRSRAHPVQSRADKIHAKLQRHIESRNTSS